MGFSLRSFRAGWDQRCIIDDLSLDLEAGELLMIVGPGGSGKSTLLAAIEGLVNRQASRPSAGRAPGLWPGPGLWWEGEQIVDFGLAARLAQHGHLDTASPRSLFRACNVEPGEQAWCWPSDLRLRAELTEVLDTPLAEIPDKLRQLLSFVLTASTGADLLLFDEPDFGQDGPWLEHVHAVFAKLRESQRSMIAVTHYLPLARTMADRVALMIDGIIVEIAATNDFFERPQKPRTQQYIQWGG